MARLGFHFGRLVFGVGAKLQTVDVVKHVIMVDDPTQPKAKDRSQLPVHAPNEYMQVDVGGIVAEWQLHLRSAFIERQNEHVAEK